MNFMQENLSTIIVGTLVFALLGLILFRLIVNIRRGKTGCPCGCEGCAKMGRGNGEPVSKIS
ncbi:MAG: FeoB-associated Cys-rich membrane protein [Treponema sp.]|jgi:hypothetical protein|nr:FeoB-associated Cys-rich membrane protein [Treponema sp.]